MTDRKIALEIKKIEVIATRYVMNHLKKSNEVSMCPLQSEILILLCSNDGKMTQKEIEELLGIRKSTLSGILNTMKKNEIIDKKSSDKDSRSKIVVLTKKGFDLYQSALKDLEGIEKKIRGEISENDIQIFFKVIDQIKTNLSDD